MATEIALWVKVFTHFLAVMFGSHIPTAWTDGTWDKKETTEIRAGGFFLYFTVDGDAGRRARAALQVAGVLGKRIEDMPHNWSAAIPPSRKGRRQ